MYPHTTFEQFNLASEEFLGIRKFNQRSKLEELQRKLNGKVNSKTDR